MCGIVPVALQTIRSSITLTAIYLAKEAISSCPAPLQNAFSADAGLSAEYALNWLTTAAYHPVSLSLHMYIGILIRFDLVTVLICVQSPCKQRSQ